MYKVAVAIIVAITMVGCSVRFLTFNDDSRVEREYKLFDIAKDK